jgi:UrcA family protein
MTKFIACAASVLALLHGGGVQAANVATVRSITVRYDDLDLNREAGARVLIRRIASAARSACGPAPDIRDLRQHPVYEACVGAATSNAIDSVHAPLVASLSGKSTNPVALASR